MDLNLDRKAGTITEGGHSCPPFNPNLNLDPDRKFNDLEKGLTTENPENTEGGRGALGAN